MPPSSLTAAKTTIASEALPEMVVAHSGRQHAYWHATSAEKIGVLKHFVTSGYYNPDAYPDRLAKSLTWVDARLRRRTSATIPSSKVVRRWRYEMPELLARAFLGNGSI